MKVNKILSALVAVTLLVTSFSFPVNAAGMVSVNQTEEVIGEEVVKEAVEEAVKEVVEEVGDVVGEAPATSPESADSLEIAIPDFEAELLITSEWSGNYGGQIVLKNNGTTTIENWRVALNGTDRLASIWDAVIEEERGDGYTIKNAGWNANIAPGSSVSFGFQATTSGDKGFGIKLITTAPAPTPIIDNEAFTVVYIRPPVTGGVGQPADSPLRLK
jgi:hypothetical protein